MEPKNRTYLVDTRNLSAAERAKVEELLSVYCWLHPMVAKMPGTYLAHTSYSAKEFAALPFPDGCTITDVTGQHFSVNR